MLLLPEVQSIFIFTPRTGSSTLAAELSERFPRSFLLYRHMESDGVPEGFTGWRRVGFVRHPLARLWSLFKFCATIEQDALAKIFPAEAARVAASVKDKSFEEWVLTNEEPFLPKETGIPFLYQRHHMPETQKSAVIYLRPDLGVVNILHFDKMAEHMKGMCLNHEVKLGATPALPVPPMTPALRKHFKRYFPWEMSLKLAVV